MNMAEVKQIRDIQTILQVSTLELKAKTGLTRIQRDLLQNQNPSALVASYSTKNIQIRESRILEDVAGVKNIPTLADLARAYGVNTYATTLLINHLAWLTRCMDSKLAKAQYTDIALMIASEYYFINLVEWNIFFKRCMMGYYEQVIWGDKINVQQLMASIRKFLSERATAISKREEALRLKESETIKTQSVNIVKGLDRVRALQAKAKTDYKAFRELFPNLPTDRSELVYWRAWRVFEQSVGKMLCEFNIENKLIKKNHE